MPSGSHRGSRGSHSSGGSRSSSSFGGSRGSHSRSSFGYGGPSRSVYHSHHYHRPIRFRWRGHYYVYSDGMTAGVALMLFALICSFFFMMIFSSNVNMIKNNINLIEEEYYYYQDIISYAEANRDKGYVVEGKILDKFYNEDADRWYITYVVDLPNTNNDLEGYSYSCYTLEETRNFRRGDTIEIAVDSIPVNKDTDSINLDYKNTTLNDDGEYLVAKSNLTKARLRKGIAIAIFVGLILLMLFVLWKKKKPEEVEKKEESKVESDSSVCAYCGASYSKTRSKCPSCGASLRK